MEYISYNILKISAMAASLHGDELIAQDIL